MAPEDPNETSQPPTPPPVAGDEMDSIGIVGTVLSERYRVGKRLGQGGMAAVYLANDLRLDRTVVIKVPHAALLMDAGFRKRFSAEISNLTRLEHPNVLQIHDVGEHEGVPFAVVQYLKGGDLSDRVEAAGGSLAPTQVLEWLPRIAETLDYVHTKGFLHRDVSPGNIIFDEHGNAFLSDFGISTAWSATSDPDETQYEFSNLTQAGGFVGAAAYAPPESISRKLNPGYDQYSLGVVVYEAMSGRLPFGRGTAEEMLIAKNTNDPDPLSETAPHLPEQLASTVMRAISKKPEDRFTSSEAFADAFRASLERRSAPPVEQSEAAEPFKTEVVQVALPKRRAVSPVMAIGGLFAISVVAFAVAWNAGLLDWNGAEAPPNRVADAGERLPASAAQRSAAASVVASAVTFQAGSTAAEQGAAYDLCVAHLTVDGCERADYADERFRSATVGPFEIDGHEVTNAEFAAWVTDSEYRTTAEKRGYSWHGFTKGTNLSWREPTRGASHLGAPTRPVVHVSRSDATAYCEASGRRLPSEEEWEYAARGQERLEFPWGSSWDPEAAGWNGAGLESAGPVGSRPAGDSWGGLQDMAGNVWEWTLTEVTSGAKTEAILKGGSWLDVNPANLRGAARLHESTDYSSSDAGFRCVKDL